MRAIRRFTAAVALVGATMAGMPAGAAAQYCTEAYWVCLNEAYADGFWLSQNLKFLECAINYYQCVLG